MPPHPNIKGKTTPKASSASDEKSTKSSKSKEKLGKETIKSSSGVDSVKQVKSNIEKPTSNAEGAKSGERDGKSSLSTKISPNFRDSVKNNEAVKQKTTSTTKEGQSISNDHGSVFMSSVKNGKLCTDCTFACKFQIYNCLLNFFQTTRHWPW